MQVKDDQRIIERDIRWPIEEAGQASSDKTPQARGKTSGIGATDFAYQNIVEITQERRGPVIGAQVGGDANAAVGFINRAIQQPFLLAGERARPIGTAIREQDLQKCLEILYLVG